MTNNKYFNSVLDGISNDISNANSGSRQTILNTASYTLGGYVPKDISEHEANDFLMKCVLRNDRFDFSKEWQDIIDSGLRDGMGKIFDDNMSYAISYKSKPINVKLKKDVRVITCSVSKDTHNKDKKPFPDKFELYEGNVQGLKDIVKQGQSIASALFSAKDGQQKGKIYRHKDHWKQAELIILDVDDCVSISAMKDKIERAKADGLLFAYTTPSHTEQKPRFRLVFVMDNIETDFNFYKSAVKVFAKMYGADISDNASKSYYGNTNAIFFDGNNNELKHKKLIKLVESAQINEKFWTVNDKGQVNIKKTDFYEYLHLVHGICSSYLNNVYVKLQVKNNILNEIDGQWIKKNIVNPMYHKGKIPKEVYEKIINSTLLRSDNLDFLQDIEVNFHKDSKDKSYVYFKNGFVKITENSYDLMDYESLNGYIWESDIRNYNFQKTDKHGIFARFINDIAYDKDVMPSALGYMLHNFKAPTTSKAVVLMDNITANKKGGGTGKSLICKALGKVRTKVMQDGKILDVQGNRFAFSNVQSNTDIVEISDIKKSHSLESIYNMITDSMRIEQKGKDQIYLDYEDSPKIIITTNHVLTSSKEYDNRRKYEVLLKTTFDSKNTPFDLYHQTFFDDWNEQEWNEFYNFMIFCLQSYLKTGLMESENKKLDFIKIEEFAYEGFYADFSEYMNDNEPHKDGYYSLQKVTESLTENMDKRPRPQDMIRYIQYYAGLNNVTFDDTRFRNCKYFRLLNKSDNLL